MIENLQSYDYVLLDACIVVDLLDGKEELGLVIGNLANLEKLTINEINLYEVRYVSKRKRPEQTLFIDSHIDGFVLDSGIDVYKNSHDDFILASDIKAEGGLFPYDALMLAQIANHKKGTICLFTLDQEFNKPKFVDKYPIVFYNN